MNLSNINTREWIIRNFGPDPRIQIDEEKRLCTLFFACEYQIELDDLKTPNHLLELICHLIPKNWVEKEMLGELIVRICGFKNWKL